MAQGKLQRFILIHYGELALKLGNRHIFEKKLVENIRRALGKVFINNLYGRFLIVLDDNSDTDLILKKLGQIPGIAYFALAYNCSDDLKELTNQVVNLLMPLKFKTFRISAKRVQKYLPYDSQTAVKAIGAQVVKKLKKKVDLENFDLNCEIELVNKMALVYFDRKPGLGGLPVGSGGKLICLISGGIDSPVAAFKMIKRGAKNIFVHFHSYPATPKEGIEKVKTLVKILNEYQFDSKLYLIPFLDIQKEIINKAPEDYRVIFYRRLMLRLAEKIAQKEESFGLITGDSLNQVASQTIENIRVISEAVNLPILRPLIGSDKEEIMDQARKIGTYDLSILPAGDCCSLYVPRHPVTRADLNLVQQVEKDWNYGKLLDKALGAMEMIKF